MTEEFTTEDLTSEVQSAVFNVCHRMVPYVQEMLIKTNISIISDDKEFCTLIFEMKHDKIECLLTVVTNPTNHVMLQTAAHSDSLTDNLESSPRLDNLEDATKNHSIMVSSCGIVGEDNSKDQPEFVSNVNHAGTDFHKVHSELIPSYKGDLPVNHSIFVSRDNINCDNTEFVSSEDFNSNSKEISQFGFDVTVSDPSHSLICKNLNKSDEHVNKLTNDKLCDNSDNPVCDIVLEHNTVTNDKQRLFEQESNNDLNQKINTIVETHELNQVTSAHFEHSSIINSVAQINRFPSVVALADVTQNCSLNSHSNISVIPNIGHTESKTELLPTKGYSSEVSGSNCSNSHSKANGRPHCTMNILEKNLKEAKGKDDSHKVIGSIVQLEFPQESGNTLNTGDKQIKTVHGKINIITNTTDTQGEKDIGHQNKTLKNPKKKFKNQTVTSKKAESKCIPDVVKKLHQNHNDYFVKMQHKTSRREFTCLICGMSFNFQTNLTRHQKTVHGKPARLKYHEKYGITEDPSKDKKSSTKPIVPIVAIDIKSGNDGQTTSDSAKGSIGAVQEVLVTPPSASKYKSVVDERGNFTCPLCERKFSFSTNLRRHLKTKHNGARLKKVITQSTETDASNETPPSVKSSVLPPAVVSSMIGVSSSSKTWPPRSKYSQFKNDKGVYICPICNKPSSFTTNLRRHMITKHRDTIFGTSFTGDKASGDSIILPAQATVLEVDSSAMLVTGSDTTKPEVTTKLYRDDKEEYTSVRKDNSNHNTKARYICQMCSKSYKFLSQLYIHKKKAHGNGHPFKGAHKKSRRKKQPQKWIRGGIKVSGLISRRKPRKPVEKETDCCPGDIEMSPHLDVSNVVSQTILTDLNSKESAMKYSSHIFVPRTNYSEDKISETIENLQNNKRNDCILFDGHSVEIEMVVPEKFQTETSESDSINLDRVVDHEQDGIEMIQNNSQIVDVTKKTDVLLNDVVSTTSEGAIDDRDKSHIVVAIMSGVSATDKGDDTVTVTIDGTIEDHNSVINYDNVCVNESDVDSQSAADETEDTYVDIKDELSYETHNGQMLKHNVRTCDNEKIFNATESGHMVQNNCNTPDFDSSLDTIDVNNDEPITHCTERSQVTSDDKNDVNDMKTDGLMLIDGDAHSNQQALDTDNSMTHAESVAQMVEGKQVDPVIGLKSTVLLGDIGGRKKETANRGHTRRRFQCTKCNKAFTFRTNLTRHIRQTHKQELPGEVKDTVIQVEKTPIKKQTNKLILPAPVLTPVKKEEKIPPKKSRTVLFPEVTVSSDSGFYQPKGILGYICDNSSKSNIANFPFSNVVDSDSLDEPKNYSEIYQFENKKVERSPLVGGKFESDNLIGPNYNSNSFGDYSVKIAHPSVQYATGMDFILPSRNLMDNFSLFATDRSLTTSMYHVKGNDNVGNNIILDTSFHGDNISSNPNLSHKSLSLTLNTSTTIQGKSFMDNHPSVDRTSRSDQSGNPITNDSKSHIVSVCASSVDDNSLNKSSVDLVSSDVSNSLVTLNDSDSSNRGATMNMQQQDSLNSLNSSATIDVVNISHETSSNFDRSNSMNNSSLNLANSSRRGSGISGEDGQMTNIKTSNVLHSSGKAHSYSVEVKNNNIECNGDVVSINSNCIIQSKKDTVVNSDSSESTSAKIDNTSPVTEVINKPHTSIRDQVSNRERDGRKAILPEQQKSSESKEVQNESFSISGEPERFPILGLYDMLSPAKSLIGGASSGIDNRFALQLPYSPIRSPLTMGKVTLATSPIHTPLTMGKVTMATSPLHTPLTVGKFGIDTSPMSSTPFVKSDEIEKNIEGGRYCYDYSPSLLGLTGTSLLTVPSFSSQYHGNNLYQGIKRRNENDENTLSNNSKLYTLKEGFINNGKILNSPTKCAKTIENIKDSSIVSPNKVWSSPKAHITSKSENDHCDHDPQKNKQKSQAHNKNREKFKGDFLKRKKSHDNHVKSSKSHDKPSVTSGRAIYNKYRFNCELCPAKFTFRTNLTRHLKKQHGVTPGEENDS